MLGEITHPTFIAHSRKDAPNICNHCLKLVTKISTEYIIVSYKARYCINTSILSYRESIILLEGLNI
jgi:hypothetical protein